MKSRLLAAALSIAALVFTAAQAQVLPPERLPGPGPSGMNFGILEITGQEAPNDLATIIGIIQAGTGTFTEGTFPILDVTDPETNANGGPILTTPPFPYLINTAGDDNDMISIAHGVLEVPEAGDYTIQVRSDDGFGLRFDGIPFTAVHGGGALDSDGSMIFTGGTGDSNSRGVINLPVGQVGVEFVTWERGGGAYYEVTSAKGVFPNAAGAQWLALGDGSHVDGFVIPNPVHMLRPALAINGADADNIDDTMAAIQSALRDPAAPRNQQDEITISSGEMPNGGGDEYSTGIFGEFLVDNGNGTPGETIQLTFTLRSDDGSALHIFGENFTAVGGDARTELREYDGDQVLTADFFTGNTNAFGLIELQEGVYGFEAFHFEGGGGDFIDIFYANGDRLGTFDSEYFPLSTDGSDREVPGNWGLKAVVPEPSSIVLAALGLLSVLGVTRRRNG